VHPSPPRGDRFDDIDRMLVERGRDVGFAGLRVATGRTGVALGFPDDPVMHVSWGVLCAAVVLGGALLLRRRSR